MHWANKMKNHYDIFNCGHLDLSVTKNVNCQLSGFLVCYVKSCLIFSREKPIGRSNIQKLI